MERKRFAFSALGFLVLLSVLSGVQYMQQSLPDDGLISMSTAIPERFVAPNFRDVTDPPKSSEPTDTPESFEQNNQDVTDPTKSSEPSDTSESFEQNIQDVTNPPKSSEPTQPSEPSQPIIQDVTNPPKSSEPTEPSEPSQPIIQDVTNPPKSSEPTQPSEPSQPIIQDVTDPTKSSEPSDTPESFEQNIQDVTDTPNTFEPTEPSEPSQPIIQDATNPSSESSTADLPWRRSCMRAKKIRLVLVHVPKAGGRSITGTFAEFQIRHRYLTMSPRSNFRKISISAGHSRLKVLQQKAGCGNSDNFLDCERISDDLCTRWMIMVREPVARTLSAFYTSTGRRNGGHFHCKKGSKASLLLKNSNTSIEDWANLSRDERKACSEVANLHVKFLAPDYPADTEEQFRAAAARLKQFAWVGLTERFQESMQLLSYTFEIDLNMYTPVFNINKYEKKLSQNARMVLNEMNKYDIRLYEIAKQIFESKFSEIQSLNPMPQDLTPFQCDKDVVCWDKANKIPGTWAPSHRPIGLTPGEYKERVLCANRNGCTRPIPPVPWYYSESFNKDALLDHLQVSIKPLDMTDQASVVTTTETLKNRKCFPAFLILGTKNGGAASLYQHIAKHPRVKGVALDQGAQSGQLLYFRNKLLKTSISQWAPKFIQEEYNRAFYVELVRLHPELESKLALNGFSDGYYITGESSVNMGPSCETPHLFTSACGKRAKLLFLVRNPIERVISHVRMRQRLNPEKGISLNGTIKGWLKELHRAQWNRNDFGHPCLFDNGYQNGIWAGMYNVHISDWLNFVDRKNILVLKTEDMLTDPLKTVKRALKHIGLDQDNYGELSAVLQSKYDDINPSTGSTQDDELSDELRHKLRDIYGPLNSKLSQNFNVDVSNWE